MSASLRQQIQTKAALEGRLLTAHMDLTYACNEHCIHCYREIRSDPELTTPETIRVLGELANLGALFLTVSGGEAMMNPGFWEILQAAHDHRFEVLLKTNATLLADASQVERLLRLRVRQVDVSLHGATAATHDHITGLHGSFEHTVRGIGLLVAAKAIHVRVHVSAMQANRNELEHIHRLTASLGVATTNLATHLLPTNAGDTAPCDMGLNPEEFAALPGHRHTPVRMLKQLPCHAGHSLLYISPYGNVTPCVVFPMVVGNVRVQTIEEIWNHSPELVAYRQQHVGQSPTCRSCPFVERCSRCPGQAWTLSRDPAAPVQSTCEEIRRLAALDGVVETSGIVAAEHDATTAME